MMRIIVVMIALLNTVSATSTSQNLMMVYDSTATLTCSSAAASVFYKTTNANVVSAITSASDTTKYTLSGNTLTIKLLSKSGLFCLSIFK